VIGSSTSTPDRPGVDGTRADNTKWSACPEVDELVEAAGLVGVLEGAGVAEVVVDDVVVAFALLLWPKFAGNCPSFPPPGQ